MKVAATGFGTSDVATAVQWVRTALASRPMPSMAVVIGAGSDALLDAVEALRPDVRLLVLEPDPVSAVRLLASAAGARRTTQGRWCCLAGPDYAGADEAWRLCGDDPDDHLLLVGPAAAGMRSAALEASRVVGRILFGARANLTARRKFAPRYLRNSLANLGAIRRGSRVDALENAWAGLPAVVVGAGPSLDAVLPVLADLAPRAVVIATDTSLRPLLHAGITPQVVVGADPSEQNARHFFNLPPCDDTWLVAESALDPRAAAAFAGRTAWFRVADHEPWPWFRTLGIDTAGLEMWGSVLTAAYQTARLAGCDPIAFVGADLAFTGGRPYARGTTYEFDWAYSATLGAGLDEAWRQQLAAAVRVSAVDIHGQEVETSQPLQAFRDWLVAHSARSPQKVINATGGGILAGPHIEQRPLAGVLGGRPPIVCRPRPTRPTSEVAPGVLVAQIETVRAEIARGNRAGPLLARWAAFGLAPLDLDGLDAALSDASRALSTAVPAGARRDFVPWTSLVAHGFTLDRLRHLPEAIAAQPEGAASDATLAQAALLASAACAAAANLAGLDPDAAAVAAGTDPRHLDWPPEVAWPLRVFDAVLPPVVAVPPAGYFGRPAVTNVETTGAGAPASDRLAARLATRYLRAVAERVAPPASHRLAGVARAVEAGVARATEAGGDASGPDDAWTITGVAHIRGPQPLTREVARRVPRPAAARALTGCLIARPDERGRARLVAADLATVAVTVDVDGVSAIVTPRVLTEESLAPATTATMVDGDAVVVPVHGEVSVRVSEDGRCHRHLAWPAPIVGELPMGEGAMAWSNGTARWPAVGDGYLLTRTTRDGPVSRQALPFRPTSGVWFAGRVYWNAFRTGLGIWTPGAAPELHFRSESFSGAAIEDDRLRLAPLTRDSLGGFVGAGHRYGWELDRNGTAVRVDLPREGACASTAAGERWVAGACPDVDLVRLTAGVRRIDLVCHNPLAVAWAGRSLVVCTAAGDVLLFERLTDTLDTLG